MLGVPLQSLKKYSSTNYVLRRNQNNNSNFWFENCLILRPSYDLYNLIRFVNVMLYFGEISLPGFLS